MEILSKLKTPAYDAEVFYTALNILINDNSLGYNLMIYGVTMKFKDSVINLKEGHVSKR